MYYFFLLIVILVLKIFDQLCITTILRLGRLTPGDILQQTLELLLSILDLAFIGLQFFFLLIHLRLEFLQFYKVMCFTLAEHFNFVLELPHIDIYSLISIIEKLNLLN